MPDIQMVCNDMVKNICVVHWPAWFNDLEIIGQLVIFAYPVIMLFFGIDNIGR